jgi:hypothetical protein
VSADRWSYCPRCRNAKVENVEKIVEDLKNQYGKVTVEEYGLMLVRLDEARNELLKASDGSTRYDFREDWDISGLDDGVITFQYSGYCIACGLKVEFTHEHPFYSRGKPE